MSFRCVALAILSAALVGCAGTDGADTPPGTGGSTGAGSIGGVAGHTGIAGAVGSGGSVGPGGSVGAGGSVGPGGAGGSITGGGCGMEDCGADCPIPVLPSMSVLPSNAKLPDPFMKVDGTRVASKAEWRCRRQEIRKQAETYILGAKQIGRAHV